MKKILILSRADLTGAGSVAADLRNFLLSSGEYDIRIFTRYSALKNDFIISLEPELKGKFNEFIRAVKFKLNQKFNRAMDFQYAPFSLNERHGWYRSESLFKKLSGFVPDVIIVLFMDGFLNFRNIYDFHKEYGSEIYFYPMDMALMTGGCHYSTDCEGFTVSCDDCPIFRKRTSVARQNLLFKEEYLKKFPFSVLSASTELYDQLTRSYLFRNAPVHKYILPVDSEIFRPKEIPDHMGLSPVTKKILIGSQTIGLRRKGADLIIDILNQLYDNLEKTGDHKDIEVIIVGKSTEKFLASIKFSKKDAGRLSLKGLVDLYNISDVFISASREDSGPMMINQSLMCGTPVISFDVGVAKDLVTDNITGFRIRKFDVADFALRLGQLLRLSPDEKKVMRKNCRDKMLNIERIRL